MMAEDAAGQMHLEVDMLTDQALEHRFTSSHHGVEIDNPGVQRLPTAESQELTREGGRSRDARADFTQVSPRCGRPAGAIPSPAPRCH